MSVAVPPSLGSMRLRVSVLQGRDLIAKDRNLFGRRSTSDPYVQVYVKDNGVKGPGKLLGRTKTIKKSLSPVWNEHFDLMYGADSAQDLLQQHPSSGKTLTFILWDNDDIGEDDPMGTVTIPISNILDPSFLHPKWYRVGNGDQRDSKTYCRNAKGDLEVRISVQGHAMREVGRGQQTMLQHNRIRVGLSWDVEFGQHIDLDCSCIAVGKQGQVIMEDTVYYGNLSNTNSSVNHSGDERTGEASGDDERILLELDRIPKRVMAMYFLLTIATAEKTFAHVKSAQVRFIATESRAGICRYVPHELGANNTSLFLVRLSRSPQNPTRWDLRPIEEGNDMARDFGSLIPEIKGYTRDLVPHIYIDPQERMAIMRKGGTIRVTDYIPGHTIPSHLTFGLAWDVTNGVNIDLDASVLCLDSSFEVLDTVNFKQLVSKDGSIRHSGDEREGDEDGDDEMIHLNLLGVFDLVHYLVFVINSFSGQELDDVDRASCHLFDPKSRRDVARYTLSNNKEVDKHTSLIVACLYRGEPDANNRGAVSSEWFLHIMSRPSQGRVVHKNVPDVVHYLRSHPPQAPAQHPEPEIVVTSMPDAIQVEEEEIVLVPQTDLGQYVVPATVVSPGVVPGQASYVPPAGVVVPGSVVGPHNTVVSGVIVDPQQGGTPYR